MTKGQIDLEVHRFKRALIYFVESGLQRLDTESCKTKLHRQYERYELSLCDVIHCLLENGWEITRHPSSGEQFQINGEGIDGESITIVAALTSENTLKITNIWTNEV